MVWSDSKIDKVWERKLGERERREYGERERKKKNGTVVVGGMFLLLLKKHAVTHDVNQRRTEKTGGTMKCTVVLKTKMHHNLKQKCLHHLKIVCL